MDASSFGGSINNRTIADSIQSFANALPKKEVLNLHYNKGNYPKMLVFENESSCIAHEKILLSAITKKHKYFNS